MQIFLATTVFPVLNSSTVNLLYFLFPELKYLSVCVPVYICIVNIFLKKPDNKLKCRFYCLRKEALNQRPSLAFYLMAKGATKN